MRKFYKNVSIFRLERCGQLIAASLTCHLQRTHRESPVLHQSVALVHQTLVRELRPGQEPQRLGLEETEYVQTVVHDGEVEVICGQYSVVWSRAFHWNSVEVDDELGVLRASRSGSPIDEVVAARQGRYLLVEDANWPITMVRVRSSHTNTEGFRDQKESAVFVPPADVVLHGEVTDTSQVRTFA